MMKSKDQSCVKKTYLCVIIMWRCSFVVRFQIKKSNESTQETRRDITAKSMTERRLRGKETEGENKKNISPSLFKRVELNINLLSTSIQQNKRWAAGGPSFADGSIFWCCIEVFMLSHYLYFVVILSSLPLLAYKIWQMAEWRQRNFDRVLFWLFFVGLPMKSVYKILSND